MRRVLVGVLFAAVLPAACAGGSEERDPVASVTEYVGTVAGVDPAVPEPGKYVVAVTIARDGKVLAYACDGLGSSTSLAGTERRGRLDLRSDDGAARLRAEVRQSTVTGTVTLAGSTQAFAATRQTGVGGLYRLEVHLSPDGAVLTITGTSQRGNRLTATVTAGQAAALAARAAAFPLSFTLVDGTRRTIRLGAPERASAGLGGFDQYWLAFLDSGSGRGHPTTDSTKLVSTTPLGASLLPATSFIPPATRDVVAR